MLNEKGSCNHLSLDSVLGCWGALCHGLHHPALKYMRTYHEGRPKTARRIILFQIVFKVGESFNVGTSA